MGRSLDPDLNGTNIAFAAGTGTLTFMDIVGAIARHNLKIQELPEPLGPDFKFYLYVSFPDRSDSVGLELCEALHKYCEDNKIYNFSLHVRLSREGINSERWSDKWIDKTLKQFKYKDLKKIWVCGPPPMSETFEKYLYKLEAEGKTDKSYKFEIL